MFYMNERELTKSRFGLRDGVRTVAGQVRFAKHHFIYVRDIRRTEIIFSVGSRMYKYTSTLDLLRLKFIATVRHIAFFYRIPERFSIFPIVYTYLLPWPALPRMCIHIFKTAIDEMRNARLRWIGPTIKRNNNIFQSSIAKSSVFSRILIRPGE